MTAAISAKGLVRKFGRVTALDGCTLEVPAGSVTGLVGTNGAGKSTLLAIAATLLEPDAGELRVLGLDPARQQKELLPLIGYVAQERPLYQDWPVGDMLEFGRRTNRVWDGRGARERLARYGVPLDRRVYELSGGQQAQVALTLAIGKRPKVLLLDEPAAALDPLARHSFNQSLMEEVAESGVTVLIASHGLPDLERVCDRLILLAGGRVQLAQNLDELVASHRRLVGPRSADLPAGAVVVAASHTDRQTTLVVRGGGSDTGWEPHPLSLQDIVLAYLANPAASVPEAAAAREEVPA